MAQDEKRKRHDLRGCALRAGGGTPVIITERKDHLQAIAEPLSKFNGPKCLAQRPVR
jgi:hypothetical protein